MDGGSIFDDATMGVTILRVRDVATSVEWYRDHLGVEPLHVGADGPEHPIATYQVGGIFFTLWQLPAGTERNDVADSTTYATFLLPHETNLESRRRRLAVTGVRVDRVVRTSENNRLFQFSDLDGNRWELAQPTSAASASVAEDLTAS